MRLACSLAGLIVLFLWAVPAASQILLNEYVSSNVDGIRDEDDDTSDWIELYNGGLTDVNLSGYAISDEPAEPFRWLVGDHVLPAQERVVIFASGKDRHPESLHWETLIDWGDLWRYRANESEPPWYWRETWYDAQSWHEGPSGFGFGDDDDSTEVSPVVSISIRTTFEVEDPANVISMLLHVDFDDAFVAWLNGQEIEIARQNIWSYGPPEWNQPADHQHEARIYRGLPPETYFVGWAVGALQPGTNVLALEVHNAEGSNDMSLIPFLTLGLAEPPQGGRDGLAEILEGLLPPMHANFKLSAEGETLSLRDPQGVLVDQVETGRMVADISRGRAPDGGPSWVYFTDPTPWEPNGLSGFEEFADDPIFSVAGGLYDAPLSLELSSPDTNGVVYYTTDGGEPDEASIPYTTPISITETSIIRARAFEPGTLPSATVTQSYILNDPSTLAVTSFVTDPDNLWDPEIGIFYEDNVWAGWERPMNVELFEPDGTPALSQEAGVKVYGGWTRTFPQKSMRLIARGGYGSSSFDHLVFDEKPITSFKQIVWRNSGNDWCASHLRDGLMHRIVTDMDIDRLAYRPCRTYINGEYWGILNARERIDEDYLASNHGIDPDNVDLIKLYYEVVAGDPIHYFNMIQYIEEDGLASDSSYAYIRTQMDVDEFAEYQIAQIFFANTDWPGNNVASWRPRTPDGRWRWIIYDTDFGLGLEDNYYHNTLAFALDPNGPEWPNPPYSTFLLRNLVENATFKNDLINRYCDHLNTTFLSARTVPMAESIAGVVEPEAARHYARWERPLWYFTESMNIIYEFLNERPAYARNHLSQEFNLGPQLTLSLDVSPAGSGGIQLTGVKIDTSWSGTYFEGIPIPLTAVPDPGFEFVEWSDPMLPDTSSVVITPDGNYSVTAIFQETVMPGIAVINEINYHSADTFNPGDWVELHNPGDLSLDVGGWTFKDENDAHVFAIAPGFTLPADGFVVLCEDTTLFKALFPEVSPILGNLGFGFSGGGEMLRLFDGQSALYDFVQYDDDPPWPTEPDGLGPTLELIDPYLDNNVASSWQASLDHGSPGEVNGGVVGVPFVAPPMALLLPAPNPFNPQTRIRFSLDRRRQLDLSIYDVAGRRVRALANGPLDAGHYTLTWDGRSDRGLVLPSGVYWLLLDAEGFRSTAKLVMIR